MTNINAPDRNWYSLFVFNKTIFNGPLFAPTRQFGHQNWLIDAEWWANTRAYMEIYLRISFAWSFFCSGLWNGLWSALCHVRWGNLILRQRNLSKRCLLRFLFLNIRIFTCVKHFEGCKSNLDHANLLSVGIWKTDQDVINSFIFMALLKNLLTDNNCPTCQFLARWIYIIIVIFCDKRIL